MGTAARTVAALAGAVLTLGMVGCGATVGVPPGSAGPTGSSGSSRSPGTAGPGGLRGVLAPRVDCSPHTMQPPGSAPIVPKAPVQMIVCPLMMPSARTKTVTLRPVPADLLAALSLPDTPRPTDPNYACAAYADVPRVVFVQTADGSLYRLHIPVDGACGHYLPGPLRLLDHYAPALVPSVG